MPTIQANGCDFYYELEGEGPDLVFIHGEIHGLEYWEHQIPGLRARSPLLRLQPAWAREDGVDELRLFARQPDT